MLAVFKLYKVIGLSSKGTTICIYMQNINCQQNAETKKKNLRVNKNYFTNYLCT